ncbi:uncharacterized protein BT62DRAFT_920483 [Guyanagaster necrorhizus]|uniref:Metallothionein n=1 Tax=Guyanagaster necrorhizus TaxID=856835 RepID=A0A9P7VPV1_9AGAR|nr:uncharacterized protein BT62DRAFT_920483 [Guyanagaster necrorhizus MCA 3950]KAG7445198.1 hypothetical protein BT62DRAFT_920483 [Guyanagaster necrorhizus MCA 3950]
MGDNGGDICALLCCGLCCTAGGTALSSWSIQKTWGANGCCCCCTGNGQAGCCGSCCDKCFNEDDFDEQTKKDSTNQQMQPAQQMYVPDASASEPPASIPGANKDTEA